MKKLLLSLFIVLLLAAITYSTVTQTGDNLNIPGTVNIDGNTTINELFIDASSNLTFTANGNGNPTLNDLRINKDGPLMKFQRYNSSGWAEIFSIGSSATVDNLVLTDWQARVSLFRENETNIPLIMSSSEKDDVLVGNRLGETHIVSNDTLIYESPEFINSTRTFQDVSNTTLVTSSVSWIHNLPDYLPLLGPSVPEVRIDGLYNFITYLQLNNGTESFQFKVYSLNATNGRDILVYESVSDDIFRSGGGDTLVSGNNNITFSSENYYEAGPVWFEMNFLTDVMINGTNFTNTSDDILNYNTVGDFIPYYGFTATLTRFKEFGKWLSWNNFTSFDVDDWIYESDKIYFAVDSGYQTGNFESNNASWQSLTGGVYSEMWNYSSNATAWSFSIPVAGVYYNLTGMSDEEYNNGFIFTSNSTGAGGSYLTANVGGVYQASMSLSFEATIANGLYSVAVVKNFEVADMRRCYARRWATSNIAGNVGVTCLMDLDVGDHVNIQIENEAGNKDINVHNVNLNLVRVGD